MERTPELMMSLLKMEFGKSEDEAKQLVNKHTDIMTHWIMNGERIRAVAMAMLMREDEGKALQTATS